MLSFLDMSNYLGRFTSLLASFATPLRQLIKKANAFAHMPHHHLALQAIIDEICSHTILQVLQPGLDLVLECDASKVALGMMLMQDFSQEPWAFGIEFIDVTCLEPLAFTSKTLTPTKQHYINIERGMLAVIFDLKKFEYYILDHLTLVLSDHKPLSSIISKDIGLAPPCLQCML